MSRCVQTFDWYCIGKYSEVLFELIWSRLSPVYLLLPEPLCRSCPTGGTAAHGPPPRPSEALPSEQAHQSPTVTLYICFHGNREMTRFK